MNQSKIRGRTGRIVVGIIMWVLLILFVIPFFIVVIDSLKTTGEIMGNPLSLPSKATFDNFTTAFTTMNYPSAFLNTLLITVISVALICLLSCMTAYFLVRTKSKISAIIFMALVIGMMVPFQAIMIPLVSIYGGLGILSSRITLIYMYCGFGCGMAVFIFHGFIKSSVPVSLEEAAKIDGANMLQVFFLIVLPLLKPVIATIAVLDVLWIWNDYLLPSLVLTQPNQLTLPLSTYAFSGTMSVNFGPLIAALLLTIIPVLVIYIVLQKYIIEGIVAGAVKN